MHDLKELLEGALEVLEQYDDEQKIKLVSNTYFLGHPRAFIGIAGYDDGGYVALDWLEDSIENDDENEDE